MAPSRLYLVPSILICWHVKVGDKETCGNQSSYGCSTDRLLYLDQRHESLVPRNESLVPKHESLVPKYESLVPKYERLASWHCRKLLLNPLLPTVPSGAQKKCYSTSTLWLCLMNLLGLLKNKPSLIIYQMQIDDL